MNARSLATQGLFLLTAVLVPACSSSTPAATTPADSNDGAAPTGPSGGDEDSGTPKSNGGSSSGGSSSGGSSSGGSSSGGSSGGTYDSGATDEDSAAPQKDSGSTDASRARDAAACIRPPYQTTNECTGIGTSNGPKIPSCSKFDPNGILVCPSIPGCTVVPDPTGNYCMGDNVTCGLSDCGHICLLPNWDPCYDVASGECLEGC